MRRYAVVVATLALAACSSSLGGGAFDVPPEGVTAPIACADPNDVRPRTACPGHVLVPNDTALTALADVQPVAAAALGAATRWTGRVRGVGIPRPGQAAAANSGWVASYCLESSVLVIDSTGGYCQASNRCDCPAGAGCDGIDCATLGETPLPAVDSDAAITAAFPGDAAGATYTLDLDVTKGGAWSVTRDGGDPTTVRVDATTGSVIPAS